MTSTLDRSSEAVVNEAAVRWLQRPRRPERLARS